MSDQNRKPPKHALNSPKLRLSAPCPTAKGKYSSLSWDVYQNNPRVVVATNDPNLSNDREKNFGRITAALEAPTFYMFLELLKDTIANKEAAKQPVIQNFGNPRNAERGAPPKHMTDLGVGRDAEGQIYIYVASKEDGWPMIKFVFGPPDQRFHKLVRANGESLSKAEVSELYARAYVNLLTQVMGNVLDTHYIEPPKFVPGGQRQGGGGYNRSGGGGGGNYNRGNAETTAPADAGADDDFPF